MSTGYNLLVGVSLLPVVSGAALLLAKDEFGIQFQKTMYGSEFLKQSKHYVNIPKLLKFTHIIGGTISTFSYLHQFNSKQRELYPNFHHKIGYMGLLFGGIATTSAMVWSLIYSDAGNAQKVPTVTVFLGWLFCSLKAFKYIKNKNYKKHEIWMIRSYGFISFTSAVRVLWTPFLKLLNFNIDELWTSTFWGGLFFNLIISEWCVNNRNKNEN